MTWIGSFVNGSPSWMPANQVNWKLASGDMTESTDGSSYVSFHSSTLKATWSGGLAAIPTSKIEKERRRNSLRRSVSFARLPCYTANHCRPGREGPPALREPGNARLYRAHLGRCSRLGLSRQNVPSGRSREGARGTQSRLGSRPAV